MPIRLVAHSDHFNLFKAVVNFNSRCAPLSSHHIFSEWANARTFLVSGPDTGEQLVVTVVQQ